MNKAKKAFYIMIGVLSVTFIAGGGGFYLTDQRLQEKSVKISELKADQAIIEQQVNIYEDARQKIEELSFIEDLANQVLPESKEQAELISEIRTFAELSNMPIQSIDFNSGNSLTLDLDTSQTTPADGIAGVLVLPTNVTFQVSERGPLYSDLIEFLERIENNRRKMQITDITLSPNPENPNLLSAVNVSIDVFVSAGVAPVATDAAGQPLTDTTTTGEGL